MGYYIRHLKNKVSVPDWKVQYVSCKKKDQRPDSNAKYPKRTWDVPKERWRYLGFHLSMDLSEARIRAKQLNRLELLKR